MASFTFRLDCDNAAFYDPVEDKFDPAREIARLLRRVADQIETEGTVNDDALMDENGNRVGDFYLLA